MEIIRKDPFYLIGPTINTQNVSGKADQDIPSFWNQFSAKQLYNQIPNKTSPDIYGLYSDYEGDYTEPYFLTVGCRVSGCDTIPENMVCKEIPAATYAVFPITGEMPMAILTTWQEIWTSDLKRTYCYDFELYKNQGKDVEIYIGIEE